MKKYRLKECSANISSDSKFVSIMPLPEIYDCRTKAEDALFCKQNNNPNCYYRIEEVKESIMDRVKSYEDACEVLGKIALFTSRRDCTITCHETTYDTDANGERYIDGSEDIYTDDVDEHIIALLKLETITAALNEGWIPDWENGEEEKWQVTISNGKATINAFPILLSPFCLSRLYFKSKELAEYAAKQFGELYKQLFLEKF